MTVPKGQPLNRNLLGGGDSGIPEKNQYDREFHARTIIQWQARVRPRHADARRRAGSS